MTREQLKFYEGKNLSQAEWHLLRIVHSPYCYDENTTSPRDRKIDEIEEDNAK